MLAKLLLLSLILINMLRLSMAVFAASANSWVLHKFSGGDVLKELYCKCQLPSHMSHVQRETCCYLAELAYCEQTRQWAASLAYQWRVMSNCCAFLQVSSAFGIAEAEEGCSLKRQLCGYDTLHVLVCTICVVMYPSCSIQSCHMSRIELMPIGSGVP